MAITTIQNLKDVLNTGARSNLFRVTLTGLADGDRDDDFSYLCKAAQLITRLAAARGFIKTCWPRGGRRRAKACGWKPARPMRARPKR